MNQAWTIARIRGIPIRIHISLLIFLPYAAYAVSTQFNANYGMFTHAFGLDPGPLTLPPLAWGFVLAIALLAGIVLHELAHSLVALSSGLKVESITLLLLGGISRIQGEILQPAREAWMAAAGPLTSLGIAVVSILATLAFRHVPSDVSVAGILFAQINLVLAIFNLLPAFPMDGGRILRAALTPRFGRMPATRIAAMIGRAMAVAFAVLGLVSGAYVLALIGVFVWFGASIEATGLEVRTGLAGQSIGALADPRIGQVTAETSIPDLAERFLVFHWAACRVGDGVTGRDSGFITLADLEKIGPRGSRMRAGDLARRDLPVVRAEEDAARVVAAVAGRGRGAVLVVNGAGDLVGIFSRKEAARAVALAAVIGDTRSG